MKNTLLKLQAQVDCIDVNIPNCGERTDANLFTETILPVVFGIAGALSVLFIVIGGFKYVISAGDPTGVNNAKNTIIYAVVGLIVSFSAFVIVNYVLDRL